MLAVVILGSLVYYEVTGTGKHQFGILPLAYYSWDLAPSPALLHQFMDASGQANRQAETQLIHQKLSYPKNP